jgi:3-deoxy-D-arabino-heptulosonate 7-phosphate (DAHP) synthase
LTEVYKSAILVKSQKAEIFQVGKRKMQNKKMIDKWGNAKQASPRQSYA